MRRNLASNLHEVELFIAEKPRSQKEIADYFSVDRQTVRRAIDRLSLYTTLTEYRKGRNTVYAIDRPKHFEFTPLELSTLILAQEAIISTGNEGNGSPFAESAKSLIGKVRSSIAPPLKRRLDSLATVFGSAVIPAKDFSSHFSTIEILVKAASDRRYAQVNYRNLKGEVTSRRVAVYNVYFDPDGATLKMIGFDEKRNAIVPFSIDHIQNVELADEEFVRPVDFELKQFLEDNCFNGIHGKAMSVKLRLFGTTAQVFLERKFHSSQRVIRTRKMEGDKHSIVIEMTVARGRGLERFIQSWLPEIEVISPPELREKIRGNLTMSLGKDGN